MATDVGRWGHSLANVAELLFPCLDAVRPRLLIEIGAYAGDTTRLLLDWAAREPAPARVISIDPAPHEDLEALAADRPQLELDRRRSLEALAELPSADAVIIDGEHNYYTVSAELRLIEQRAGEGALPLLVCHDVGWPHARRDAYYSLESIPAEHRQPASAGVYLHPDDAGYHDGGLSMVSQSQAEQEGGPRNGVLTAVEDFLHGRGGLRFALVPAFFGLGVIWSRDAPYAPELERILTPWDRNPIVARLEANRVLHLANWQVEQARAGWAGVRIGRKDQFLQKLLTARTFALAAAMNRMLHPREEAAFSKDELQRVIDG